MDADDRVRVVEYGVDGHVEIPVADPEHPRGKIGARPDFHVDPDGLQGFPHIFGDVLMDLRVGRLIVDLEGESNSLFLSGVTGLVE